MVVCDGGFLEHVTPARESVHQRCGCDFDGELIPGPIAQHRAQVPMQVKRVLKLLSASVDFFGRDEFGQPQDSLQIALMPALHHACAACGNDSSTQQSIFLHGRYHVSPLTQGDQDADEHSN